MRPAGITVLSPEIGRPSLVSMRKAAMHKAFIRWREQRYNSEHRGIPFLLTLADWLAIWVGSGHYHQRGRRRGEFVMSRPKDQGSYVLGNVAIVPCSDNSVEAQDHRIWTDEQRAKIACGLKDNTNALGYRHDAATLRKIRRAAKARAQDPAWVAATSARLRSPEARRKNSEGVKAAWARRRAEASR